MMATKKWSVKHVEYKRETGGNKNAWAGGTETFSLAFVDLVALHTFLFLLSCGVFGDFHATA